MRFLPDSRYWKHCAAPFLERRPRRGVGGFLVDVPQVVSRDSRPDLAPDGLASMKPLPVFHVVPFDGVHGTTALRRFRSRRRSRQLIGPVVDDPYLFEPMEVLGIFDCPFRRLGEREPDDERKFIDDIVTLSVLP